MQFRSSLNLVKANSLLKPSLCLLLSLTLVGCSWIPSVPVPGMDRIVGEEGIFRDRKEEYLEAGSIPRTEIPDGLDSYIIDDLLIIPDLPPSSFTAFPDAPRPTPMEGRSDREVVIQKMQDRSWIIADASPSQVWPRIRDYWRQKGVGIELESPTQGIMDTGWFTLDNNVLTREKFRVVVETGFQNNSSEVKLTHASAPQSTPTIQAHVWAARSMDEELEAEFLLDLSQYLADVANLYQASTVSLLAGTLSNTGKATMLTTQSGNSLLRLQADYDRSWAAVKRALTRSNIAIVQDNVELGTFDLNIDPAVLEQNDDDEDDGPGFFKRLITLNGVFSKADPARIYRVRLQVLDAGEVVEVLALPRDDSNPAETKVVIDTLMTLLSKTVA